MGQSLTLSKLIIEETTLCLVGTQDGLVFIGREDYSQSFFDKWRLKYFTSCPVIYESRAFIEEKAELVEYFAGRRESFTFQYSLVGTEFQKLVWQELQKSTYGTTCSYTDLANQIGREDSVRATANAVGQNPLLIVIPCHRVLRKDGSLGGFRDGLWLKKRLLQIENLRSESLK